jgi:chlorophyll/bacteriochlorophyll a synthase
MSRYATSGVLEPQSVLPAVVELLKPITWFPPMWAMACGVVSTGIPLSSSWPTLAAGVLLAGPMVCATSQAANDWFDRHVDAINEPHRPIPSGRLPGRMGLYVAITWTLLSLAVATVLGAWGFVAAVVGLALAWVYSAPPLRLKRNGWYGNAACAACYEGLPWFTGAALMVGTLPDARTIAAAALYSIGAHGIMTLNDFKSIEGDRLTGIASLPVQLGMDAAARTACIFMLAPQLVVIALLLAWSQPLHATAVAVLVAMQVRMMLHFIAAPRDKALWYSGFGVPLYVLGMMITAFAIRGLVA